MRRTRRTILAGLGSLTAAVAGCTTGTDLSEEQDHPLKDISVEETSLVVELAAGASVEQVNVIAPDGSTFGKKVVAEGATRVDFEIGMSYDPGEYRIVAMQEEESVVEETLKIAPEVRITEVGVGANYPDQMPDELGDLSSSEALVQLENNGNGPQEVEKLLFQGMVPNPTTDLKDAPAEEVSGIFNHKDGQGELKNFHIPGHAERTVYSNTIPFSFQGDGVSCESEPQTGELEVILRMEVGEGVVESFPIEYTGTSNGESCDIDVGGP